MTTYKTDLGLFETCEQAELSGRLLPDHFPEYTQEWQVTGVIDNKRAVLFFVFLPDALIYDDGSSKDDDDLNFHDCTDRVEFI